MAPYRLQQAADGLREPHSAPRPRPSPRVPARRAFGSCQAGGSPRGHRRRHQPVAGTRVRGGGCATRRGLSSRPSEKRPSFATAPTQRPWRSCSGSCTPSAVRGTKPSSPRKSLPSANKGNAMSTESVKEVVRESTARRRFAPRPRNGSVDDSRRAEATKCF